MKIYHYTSLDSLAQILRNRTIQFNRLDMVDDIEEGSVQSKGIFLGHYIFVSCWTEQSEESIPMWNMYARGGVGVRIALEKDMFRDYLVQGFVLPNGLHTEGTLICKLPQESFITKDYFVLPVLNMKEPFFYRTVEYVDNVKEKTEATVNMLMNDNKTFKSNIAFGKIGKYKNKRWEFQHETRFALTILPINPLMHKPEEVPTLMMNAFIQNISIPFNNYYMHLKNDVIENIEIILSPEANEGHRLIVESLCKQYLHNDNAKIELSSLGQCVRFK